MYDLLTFIIHILIVCLGILHYTILVSYYRSALYYFLENPKFKGQHRNCMLGEDQVMDLTRTRGLEFMIT